MARFFGAVGHDVHTEWHPQSSMTQSTALRSLWLRQVNLSSPLWTMFMPSMPSSLRHGAHPHVTIFLLCCLDPFRSAEQALLRSVTYTYAPHAPGMPLVLVATCTHVSCTRLIRPNLRLRAG